MADGNQRYWLKYNNLQRVKHDIIRSYLNGWLPKLTLGQYGAGRITYFDTHAGRGRHATGELGSPLLALKTVLDHRCFDRLKKTELQFFFIEHDADNLAALQQELADFGKLPDNVIVQCEQGDCAEVLGGIVQGLNDAGARMAPSFVFCDPYGFTIPGGVLTDIMRHKGVELFINVIWRELNMALIHGRKDPDGGMAARLDTIFDGHDWTAIDSDNFDIRADQCAQLFRQMVGAKWATYIRMLGRNDVTRYFLLHLTNHDAGRELMKESIWKSCPEGGFHVRQTDDPSQQFLIKPEPDLGPVEAWVIGRLSSGPLRWKQLIDETRPELWLKSHTNQVVRNLRHEGAIVASDYHGPCTPSNNPMLALNR